MGIILAGLGGSYYGQIKRLIASQILSGALYVGYKIPSIWALEAQLSVSVIYPEGQPMTTMLYRTFS